MRALMTGKQSRFIIFRFYIFWNAVQSELRNMTSPPTDLSVRYTEYYKERYKNTVYVGPKNKEIFNIAPCRLGGGATVFEKDHYLQTKKGHYLRTTDFG